jgi:hypothetical protein
MTLQTLDPTWLNAIGDAAPSLRAVAASDHNAFAVGDVVMETGEAIDGVAVVSSALAQVGPNGMTYTPVGGSSTTLNPKPFVVVAVAPALPSIGGVSPVLAAGEKGANGLVWVIPAGNREFLIRGDASVPARREWAGPNNPPLNLPRVPEDGCLFADLRYGPPSGGMSGTTLDGSSFTDGNVSVPIAGPLYVIALAQGQQFAPHALYRVRFRNLG